MLTNSPGLVQKNKTGSSYFHKLLETGLKIHFQKDTSKVITFGNDKNLNYSLFFLERLGEFPKTEEAKINVNIFQIIYTETLNKHAPLKTKIYLSQSRTIFLC